ncbi:hypothetical protein BT96DRAFT_563429 [Gymnopus androsaceus JB14]|uniref:Helicase C-terminal domain-containing protein n=1 Tax=Gymnopus androsaceus JB14 TaxID=1447944 RepID=A0A6A4HUT6_9AGAR|nr:hypothetical protein BT96DRAFT_563429 [Gymnopus androsaceus JB14]
MRAAPSHQPNQHAAVYHVNSAHHHLIHATQQEETKIPIADTLVIQVGIPASADQYVHRLGRTAHAGAGGQGIIVLDPREQPFVTSHDMQKTTTIVPYISAPSSHEAKEL